MLALLGLLWLLLGLPGMLEFLITQSPWVAWVSCAACGAWVCSDTWVLVAILKSLVRLRPSLSGFLFQASERAARCWLQLEMQHFHASRERTATAFMVRS